MHIVDVILLLLSSNPILNLAIPLAKSYLKSNLKKFGCDLLKDQLDDLNKQISHYPGKRRQFITSLTYILSLPPSLYSGH